MSNHPFAQLCLLAVVAAEPWGYYGARVGFRGRSIGFGGRIGKREAEADPISFGYRGRSGRFYGVGYRGRSGRFYGVRLGKREAQPYGYIGVRGGFRGRSFGFGRRFGKREA